MFRDSVIPVEQAVEPTSGSETVLVTGDCVHHPFQFAHPATGACVDIGPRPSEATRRGLLASLADTDPLSSTHTSRMRPTRTLGERH